MNDSLLTLPAFLAFALTQSKCDIAKAEKTALIGLLTYAQPMDNEEDKTLLCKMSAREFARAVGFSYSYTSETLNKLQRQGYIVICLNEEHGGRPKNMHKIIIRKVKELIWPKVK